MYEICAKNKDKFIIFEGVTLTGKEFNELFADINFYKLTNRSEVHNGFKFVDGLNVDTIPFDPKCICCPGGIYFTQENSIINWLIYNNSKMRHKRLVKMPDDAKVHFESNKLKADKLILGPRYHL